MMLKPTSDPFNFPKRTAMVLVQGGEAANDAVADRFIRTPELDKRVERGDMFNGNAWFEVATGKTRYFMRSRDPNAKRWLPVGSHT